MAQKIGSFLAIVAFVLALAYGVDLLWGGHPIVDGAVTALKTLGWLVFWAFALIVRTIGEAGAALAQVAMDFFQGQATWLPNIPPLF